MTSPSFMLRAGALSTLLLPVTAVGGTLFRGDFETGDLSQWVSAPKTEAIKVVTDPVREGSHALRIDGTNAAVRKGHDRIELQHQPKGAGTSEGTERWFGWSVLLPAALPKGSHSMGYFEARNTWSRVMAFDVHGEDIEFTTRVPFARQWTGKGKLTPGRWHDFALHVLWSRDADKGFVEFWFDGERVVPLTKTATLRDENPVFFQIGLFRETCEVPETLFIDHIVEATTREEVTPKPAR